MTKNVLVTARQASDDEESSSTLGEVVTNTAVVAGSGAMNKMSVQK